MANRAARIPTEREDSGARDSTRLTASYEPRIRRHTQRTRVVPAPTAEIGGRTSILRYCFC